VAPTVELRRITKRFGTVVANDGLDFSVEPGEVHALLGENGAGKSTLTRILYGLSQPDDGELLVDGTSVRFSSPKDAMAAGIGMVTQEFSLVAPMTVTENVMLSTLGFGRFDRVAARSRVVEVATRVGIAVDPDARVGDLSVGERQRVEILKALNRECRVLVLDEPTAVLVPQDADALFDTIRALTADGLGVVFISHKLHEVTAIADRVTVIRRGRNVATRPAAGLEPRAIAALMVGAEVGDAIDDEVELAAVLGAPLPHRDDAGADHPTGAAGPEPVLDLVDVGLDSDGVTRLDGVALRVHGGEIVGVAGVSGNGQTELVQVLSGTAPATRGRVIVAGRDVTAADPLARLAAGLGRITEDRKGSVVPDLTVEQNLVLEDLDSFRRGRWFVDRRRVREHTRALIEQFDIRADATAPVRTLSGGNMQKVLLARALARQPKVLVASQPTRWLDVGACEYVHGQLRSVRDRGGGVLLISEDLDELLALADRIVVMVGGRIVGETSGADATPESVGLMMTGAGVPA
jgi:simple sugar transport system ATP-binding protein